MEVAPLKNFEKFKTKKSKKQKHINLEQNEDCQAYARSYIPARIMHQHSRLRRSGFYFNSLRAFGAQALTKHEFRTRQNFAPCIILHLA